MAKSGDDKLAAHLWEDLAAAKFLPADLRESWVDTPPKTRQQFSKALGQATRVSIEGGENPGLCNAAG